MFEKLFCIHDYEKVHKAEFIGQADNFKYFFIFCECKKCHKRKVITNSDCFITPFDLKKLILEWEYEQITNESLKEILE